MATFYIISTTNALVEGWKIYGTFSHRKEAEKSIDDIEDCKGTDIEADTLNKNSRVVSKTAAKRYYHIDPDFDTI